MLRASMEIAKDPFYTELMPDFDWRYYRYRLLDYFAHLTDICNLRGMEGEQLTEICERSEEMWNLWHSDPDYFSELDKESYVAQLLARNRYYAKKMTPEAYRNKLLEIYHNRDKSLYDVCGVIENIQVPIELFGLCGKIHISEADKMLIYRLDYNVLAYVFHMPNSSALSVMLEHSAHFFRHFIEFPGGTRFERMMLRFLAATHPPTYVHSRMVARISTCLCGYLIDHAPELLIGVEGCSTAEEVLQKRDTILWFVWHAALCHDTGKIFIMDTIFVYGRKLLDMEFDLIKTHPKVGASILKRFPSTEKYADVALGHHKWYDNSRGYPEEFDTSASTVKTVIDLVQCADCLDAATDTVGRSYSHGKSLDEFCAEVREGSGTRYAPWLPDLLSEPEVREDIGFLLSEGREKEYYDTYQQLKTIHDKEMQ
jgi:HD-GYP domain-containing protein (c-di-GMP phosphodiesterase class II)